jgi:hypothetical protein
MHPPATKKRELKKIHTTHNPSLFLIDLFFFLLVSMADPFVSLRGSCKQAIDRFVSVVKSESDTKPNSNPDLTLQKDKLWLIDLVSPFTNAPHILSGNEMRELVCLSRMCVAYLVADGTSSKEQQLNAAYILLALVNHNAVFVSDVLDHLDTIDRMSDTSNVLGYQLKEFIFSTIDKPQADNNAEDTLDVTTQRTICLLLDMTPLPRDLILVCVDYVSEPYIATHVAIAMAKCQDPLNSGLRFLFPSRVVSLRCATDVVRDARLRTERVSLQKLPWDLVRPLVQSGKLLTPQETAFWIEWLEYGLIDLLRCNTPWVTPETRMFSASFRPHTTDTLALLMHLGPLHDARVDVASQILLETMLDHAPVAFEQLGIHASAFVRYMLCSTQRPPTPFEKILHLITHHHLIDTLTRPLQGTIDGPVPSDTCLDACAILAHLLQHHPTLTHMLKLLLRMRPRGWKEQSPHELINHLGLQDDDPNSILHTLRGLLAQ